MLSSISGQNERWAQVTAYHPPPRSQFGPGGEPGVTNGATPASGPTSKPGASPPLSDALSFALIALGGANAGPAQASQTGAPGAAPSPPDAAKQESRLFTDLQSLLTGNPRASGGGGTATGFSPPVNQAVGTNVGTGTSGTRGQKPAYGDRFQRQFALNAYSANTTAAVNRLTGAALASIKV